jgi:hypothetical protein
MSMAVQFIFCDKKKLGGGGEQNRSSRYFKQNNSRSMEVGFSNYAAVCGTEWVTRICCYTKCTHEMYTILL